MNDKPALESPEVVTSKGIGSSALLGSVVRFYRRMDTDELCCAEYKGHTIDCTAHWRRRGVWNCAVRTKAGELVAEHTHNGHDRRGMLLEAARKAGLVPNKADMPSGSK